LFVKIENDGFDLGAQRRTIDRNDLPEAERAIKEFQQTIMNRKAEKTKKGDTAANVLIVPKEKIAENGEYNLTGERYRVAERRGKRKWPMMRLEDVCEIIAGQSPDSKYYNENGIGTPFYQGKTEFTERYIGSPVKWTTQETKIAEKNDILISVRAPVGPINISTARICIGRGLAVIRPSPKILLPYLFEVIKLQERNIKGNGGAVFDSISKKDIEMITIPLPPLEVQQEIVAEIEGYQKLIDGCRQVADNWKPRIEVDSEWPTVRLGRVCEIETGGTPVTTERENYDRGSIPWLKSEVCKNRIINEAFTFITEQGLNNSSAKMLKPNTTLIALVGATIGKTGFITFEASTNQNVAGLYPIDTDKLDTLFLFYSVQGLYNKFIEIGDGNFKMANMSFVRSLEIPLPPLEIQQEIAANIEAERKIVDGCRELIVKYEEKIKKVVDGVWGE
jgi:restriction endonuclease S subunit